MKGSLSLPHPYFSIKQGRNVLFGWDPYFTNEGLLLIDSLSHYAKNAVENQLAEIQQIGFVPNASEPWGLNRSQIPFLAMSVRAVYARQPKKDTAWLHHAYRLLLTEYQFWTNENCNIEDHRTAIDGLQRFYHHAIKEELLRFYTQLAPRFNLPDSLEEKQKLQIGEAWMSEAESGMDFTPRFENRCHQFIPVDLNANLFLYEETFQWIVKELKLINEPDWNARKARRRQLLTKYCWNEKRGMFLDYDFVNKKHSTVASAASFYAMYAGVATKNQAKRMVDNLKLFEYAFGPVVCEPSTQQHIYQWDYPAGWPPIYYLVAKGLDRYNYKSEARRIAGKYLDIVSNNFNAPVPATFASSLQGKAVIEERTPGGVYEKYNAVTGTIYDAEYSSRLFHGWSYGVFLWSLNYYNN